MEKQKRQSLKDIISQVLRKKGKTPETLNVEPPMMGRESERQAYERWLAVATKGPITLDEFLDKIREEIKLAQEQLESVDVKLNERDDIWLKMTLRLNRIYLNLFSSPDTAREKLREYLKKIHNLK